ncbi:hypothetical protein N42HA_02892 [Lactococcus lactis]|nr:hypothetical protein [Lactococcus lactis]
MPKVMYPYFWSYTIKVDTNTCVISCLRRHKNERTFISGFKRYDEDFKQSLVNLYQTGKTQSELCKDYGVSQTALSKWIKQFSQVKLEDNTVMTAKQIQELQKRNAQLEEENLILKKRVPYSCKTPSKIKSRLSTPI